MLQPVKEKHLKTLLAQDLIYEKNPEEKSGYNGPIGKTVAVFRTGKTRG